MSKIDELIAKLCPDGVEYKELGYCTTVVRGKRVTKSQLKDDKKYPVISGGFKPLGYFDDYNREPETITIAQYGSAGYLDWQKERFWANDVCYSIYPSEKLNNRFLYFVLSSQQNFIYSLKTNAIPAHLPQSLLEKITIPIPPLPVQEEIVRILDKFTALEVELEAELEARTLQYEYYRNQLLAFEGKEVEWKTLGEVANYSKSRIAANEVNLDSYVGVDNLLQNKKGKTFSSYVPSSGNLTQFIYNDILIGNIRPYLKKIWKSNITGGTNGDVLVIRVSDEYKVKLISDYLYYLLSSDNFFDYNMQYAKGAKMPRGDKDSILKYKIPIPPIEEQERIVAILDQFDALVNDISTGLPAEIQARRQQYEYYRGELLTFEPLHKRIKEKQH